jgi:hypothetical protein
MTIAEIENVILDLVEEDLYGVWEVGWRCRTVLGLDSGALPKVVAQSIDSLMARQLVGIFVREDLEGDLVPLSSTDRAIELSRAEAWEVPTVGEPQFFIGSLLSSGKL